MIDDIPQISYRKSKKDDFDFEVIPLKHFFSRSDKLAHPIHRPHRLGFYHILYITKGEGRHFIDFKAYDYVKGSLLFVSEGQVHAFELNQQADGFLLLFTEAFLTQNMIHSDVLPFSRLYNYHLYSPDIPPVDTSASIFDPIVTAIYNEYIFEETFAREEMLRTLLKLLLLKAERIKRTLTPKEKNSEWVTSFNAFRRLLGAHFAETRNAGDYATMMGISYNHLNKVVKSITGNTAKAFIDIFVILEIKRRLAISDISVKELTYRMGFDEPTNFVKYFKKHTQQSPAHFKKTLTS